MLRASASSQLMREVAKANAKGSEPRVAMAKRHGKVRLYSPALRASSTESANASQFHGGEWACASFRI